MGSTELYKVQLLTYSIAPMNIFVQLMWRSTFMGSYTEYGSACAYLRAGELAVGQQLFWRL